ncbi:MAG: methyltransferase domain-containing protein [Vicinamibacterales bacterium]
MLDHREALPLLACPRCRSSLREREDAGLACSEPTCRFHAGFPMLAGQPALVDPDTSLLDEAHLAASQGASLITRGGGSRLGALARRVFVGANHVASRFARDLAAPGIGPPPVVLVVGGGTVGGGSEALYASHHIRLLAFDIYASATTALVADAHRIPLHPASVDGVWVQAVLEHVLEPAAVVAEIVQVLKPGAGSTPRRLSCSRYTRGRSTSPASPTADTAGCSATSTRWPRAVWRESARSWRGRSSTAHTRHSPARAWPARRCGQRSSGCAGWTALAGAREGLDAASALASSSGRRPYHCRPAAFQAATWHDHADGGVTRLLYTVNVARFFVSHRLPLALAARAAGYEVHVATSGDGHAGRVAGSPAGLLPPAAAAAAGSSLRGEARAALAMITSTGGFG